MEKELGSASSVLVPCAQTACNKSPRDSKLTVLRVCSLCHPALWSSCLSAPTYNFRNVSMKILSEGKVNPFTA